MAHCREHEFSVLVLSNYYMNFECHTLEQSTNIKAKKQEVTELNNVYLIVNNHE